MCSACLSKGEWPVTVFVGRWCPSTMTHGADVVVTPEWDVTSS